MNQIPAKQANSFEIVALIFAVISVMTSNILYIAVPLGALAILFAVLSRGNRMEFRPMAKVAIIVGIIGIVLTALIYTACYLFIYFEYGSIENFLQESKEAQEYLRMMCQMMGYDFEELFGPLMNP